MKNLEYVRPFSFQILESLDCHIGCHPHWRKYILSMLQTSFLVHPIFFYLLFRELFSYDSSYSGGGVEGVIDHLESFSSLLPGIFLNLKYASCTLS